MTNYANVEIELRSEAIRLICFLLKTLAMYLQMWAKWQPDVFWIFEIRDTLSCHFKIGIEMEKNTLKFE